MRGRIVVAAVAAGAAVAATQTAQLHAAEGDPSFGSAANLNAAGITNHAPAHPGQARSDQAQSDHAQPAAGEILTVGHAPDDSSGVTALARGEQLAEERAAREAEAARPDYVLPAEGTFTSGYGARWGTTHYGIDVANSIGTPIYSAADGVVIESGSASGFGMWVRVQHEDGFITVYGHINESLVSEGQEVQAGEQIATMGNRGQSTGPHLHFEVWTPAGQKINPLSWLQQHGVSL